MPCAVPFAGWLVRSLVCSCTCLVHLLVSFVSVVGWLQQLDHRRGRALRQVFQCKSEGKFAHIGDISREHTACKRVQHLKLDRGGFRTFWEHSTQIWKDRRIPKKVEENDVVLNRETRLREIKVCRRSRGIRLLFRERFLHFLSRISGTLKYLCLEPREKRYVPLSKYRRFHVFKCFLFSIIFSTQPNFDCSLSDTSPGTLRYLMVCLEPWEESLCKCRVSSLLTFLIRPVVQLGTLTLTSWVPNWSKANSHSHGWSSDHWWWSNDGGLVDHCRPLKWTVVNNPCRYMYI